MEEGCVMDTAEVSSEVKTPYEAVSIIVPF